jgi:hypothetical protein
MLGLTQLAVRRVTGTGLAPEQSSGAETTRGAAVRHATRFNVPLMRRPLYTAD